MGPGQPKYTIEIEAQRCSFIGKAPCNWPIQGGLTSEIKTNPEYVGADIEIDDRIATDRQLFSSIARRLVNVILDFT